MNAIRLAAVFVGGALFGFGLALSTMVQPEVILAFLQWNNCGLLLVLGGAAGVTLLTYRFAPRLLARPLAGGQFNTHVSVMSRDTVIGAAIFGIGWGLSGVCPGPAVASIGVGNWPVLWAMAGMFAGAWIHGSLAKAE